MRFTIRSMVASVAFLLIGAGAAPAATIGFSPSPATVSLGDSLTLDIIISDLTGEVVSAYDLDVLYDPTVLAATSVSFGLLLGDEFLFEVFNDFDLSTPGLVDLAQLSLLSDAALLLLQGGNSVVIGSIEFDAIGVGSSPLEFVFDSSNTVVGSGGLPLDLTVVAGSASVVPEPSAALMFGVGSLIVPLAVRMSRSSPRPASRK